MDRFTLDFFTDAVLGSMERWLLIKECMPPEEYLEKIKNLTEKSARAICREMDQAQQEVSRECYLCRMPDRRFPAQLPHTKRAYRMKITVRSFLLLTGKKQGEISGRHAGSAR